MDNSHALTRTSPKGQPFIGTCMKCGTPNLTMAQAMRGGCVNPANFTQEETLLIAIEGEDNG